MGPFITPLIAHFLHNSCLGSCLFDMVYSVMQCNCTDLIMLCTQRDDHVEHSKREGLSCNVLLLCFLKKTGQKHSKGALY